MGAFTFIVQATRSAGNGLAGHIAPATLVAAATILLAISQQWITWPGTAYLHTNLESLATIVAALAGTLALIRYYARHDALFLFVGTGFLGAAALDGFHTVVTSEIVALVLPSGLSSLAPWSWLAGRVFLSVMLLLGWLAWRKEPGANGVRYSNPLQVYTGAVALTLVAVALFTLLPLPNGNSSFVPFHRLEDILPGVLFLVALAGYWRKGGWRNSAFECWLVASLFVSVVLHSAMMPLSAEVFDAQFNLAHVLKLASYSCVLTGLLIDLHTLYQQAEESQARVEAVVDAVVEGIITINSRGQIETFNRGAERVFDYRASDVIGRNVRMLMPEPYHSEHDGYIAAYLHTGVPKVIGNGREVRGKRRDGSEFPLDLAVGSFQVGGETMFVGVCRDVTDRKRDRDEIEAVNRELESFAYSVSHDLRGPLRSIDGFSQALIEDYAESLEDGARKYLARIQAGTQKMGHLIDDLLTLSRATRGEFQREVVNLSDLAESIVEELRQGEPDRDVGIVIAPDMRARGDPRMLRIMLENLISNAWKFTGRTENPAINLGTTWPDGHDFFYIKDNGAGFNMEYAERLFTPFQRLHSDKEFDGTGIGLATVSRIVQRHGGRVWAESTVGKGTTFFFELGGY